MKFLQTLLSLFVIGTLSACGSSSSNTSSETTPKTSLAGKAADGYLSNARVCLDLNANKECDEGEPTTTTGDGGVFTLVDVTQAQIDANPLLVEIIKGETIDEDTPGVVLTQSYTLSAPAGYTFVSPLTTLVQNEVDNGNSLSDAEGAVKGKLGTTLSLDEDYVAGTEGDTDASEYEKLHQIAQVTAQVIASNIELLETTAKAANIDVEKLISLIFNEVFDALDEITVQVQVTEADDSVTFNPETIATSIDDELIEINKETLTEQVAQNEAESAATTTSLVSLIQGDGLNWFWSEVEDSGSMFDYGTFKLDSQGNVEDMEYSWESTQWVLQTSEDNNDEWILTSAGWVVDNDNIETVTLNDDLSITLNNPSSTLLSETVTGVELPLAGLNVSLIAKNTEGDGVLADALSNNIVFPTGSIGYKLTFTHANDYYAFSNWDDCETINQLGGLCNTIWHQKGTGNNQTDAPAVTLSQLLVSSAITIANDGNDTGRLNGIHLGWDGNVTLVAELLTNGTINYYNENYQAQTVKKIATGTWVDIQVHGQTLRKISAPNHFSEYDGFFEDRDNIVLFEYLNGVRIGQLETNDNDDDGEIVFNSVARDFILANFDPSLVSED